MSNTKSANIKLFQLMWKQIANIYEVNMPSEITKYLLLLSFENSKGETCL